jgi:hypothetical protein
MRWILLVLDGAAEWESGESVSLLSRTPKARASRQFLKMTDLALARGNNMDEQDGVQVSFQSTIVCEFCATLLDKERFFTKTKMVPILSILFIHVCLPSSISHSI